MVAQMSTLQSLRLTCCIVPDSLQLPLLARFAHLPRLQVAPLLLRGNLSSLALSETCKVQDPCLHSCASAVSCRRLLCSSTSRPACAARAQYRICMQIWCLAPPDAEESGRDLNRSLMRLLSRHSGRLPPAASWHWELSEPASTTWRCLQVRSPRQGTALHSRPRS